MSRLTRYVLPSVLVLVGLIQGCSNTSREVNDTSSSILTKKADIRNAYADCVAAISNISQSNIVIEKRNQCEQEYQKAWEKVVQYNK